MWQIFEHPVYKGKSTPEVSNFGVYQWTEDRIRAYVFVSVLALQIERWMRRNLKTVSVPKALSALQHIRPVIRPTREQKKGLAELGYPRSRVRCHDRRGL